MNKMHHAIASEFVIVFQVKDAQGNFGPIRQYDTSEVEVDAVSQCQEARNGEHALKVGARYGVIKRTTIVLEEVIEPIRAADWKAVGDEGFTG